MERSQLQIERVPLDSLHEDPANARAHGERNLEAIAASLQRFGQAEPLVVQASSGRVIGGNGRLAVMRRLGWTHADVIRLEVDDLQATALGITLNRTADLAEWDEDVLSKLLTELKDEEALDGVGFDEAEIDELLADLEADEEPDVEDVEPVDPPDEPISRMGDLWTLGDHRLIVGDSRDSEVMQRLMDGEKADLVWTDPPYGVEYEGKTKDALRIQNDGHEGLEELLQAAFGNAADACRPGAVWYVAAPAGPQFASFANVLGRLKIWRQTLIWVKDVFVLGHSDYHYRHEAIFYGWIPGAEHQVPPTRSEDTLWEFPRPKRSAEHPTMKPVDLVGHALEMSSRRGDLVLDPFAGSGTTILSAEKLGRHARVIELDPRYADVIIRRWQEATGKVATLDGVPFGKVEQGRADQ